MAARFRIWSEAGFGAASAFLFVLTLGWPQWIEAVFGAGPDDGSGVLEWLLSMAFAGVAVGMSLRARADWRRPHATRLLDGR
jgi:hypothetical protein